MSGFGNVGPFSEEEIEARHEHVKQFTLSRFAYTQEGCSEARQFLEEQGESIPEGRTGWDIVAKANRVFTQKQADEYEQFLQEAAERCSCCTECNDTPCDDVLAGGLCIGGCSCDDEYEEECNHG